MESDPKVVLMGEDIGKLGGVFRVTEGLQKDFGEDRVIDTPLAESGIIGTAIGMALRGYRPVVEIQFDGFVYPAFDQIVSQVAKMRARSLGHVAMPIVIRIPFGGGIGAVEHHSESNEAYFAHTAGLRVVACSNPQDAYWMIQQAIETDDPVDLLRAQAALLGQGRGRRRPPRRALAAPARVAARGHRRHPARLRPDGEDLPRGGPGRRGGGHAASRSSTCARCQPARQSTPSSPRSRKTGRVVVVHEASTFLGMGAEIAALVTEQALLLPRGAGAAGRRLQHALPAEPARGGVPPRPRPRARRRRPLARLLKGVLADDSVREFKLPDPGEGLTEAEIVTWHVAVGDTVKVNDIVVEVETAKSLVELPVPFAGTVAALHVAEGDTVEVGTPIIAVDDGVGGSADAVAPAPAAAAARRSR